MPIKSFLIPSMRNEVETRRVIRICASYFFVVSALFLIFALTQFGAWSFRSSDTYFRILENLFFGLAIIKSWMTVLYVLLCLQILLLIWIFTADLDMKIINTLSLIIMLYATIAVYKYNELEIT